MQDLLSSIKGDPDVAFGFHCNLVDCIRACTKASKRDANTAAAQFMSRAFQVKEGLDYPATPFPARKTRKRTSGGV